MQQCKVSQERPRELTGLLQNHGYYMEVRLLVWATHPHEFWHNVVWGADAQIGLLGKGTFGTVIEAVDTRPDAGNDRVAIKFIERGPLVCLSRMPPVDLEAPAPNHR